MNLKLSTLYKIGETYTLPIGTQLYINGQDITLEYPLSVRCEYINYDYFIMKNPSIPAPIYLSRVLEQELSKDEILGAMVNRGLE